jgi:hypothetical protein
MSIPRIDPYCAVRTEEPLERFLEPAQFIESDAAEIRAFVAAQLAGCDDVESARRASPQYLLSATDAMDDDSRGYAVHALNTV